MTFVLSAKSAAKLVGVDPRLVRVVKTALRVSPIDFTVVEGLRSLERQRELYAQGRTKPGKIVTWTLKSKHIDGKAVDLAPWRAGAIAWDDKPGFQAISKAMFTASRIEAVAIRWGADWDADGVPYEKGEYDGPHFELI